MAENWDNSVYLRLKEAFKGQPDARIAERLGVSRSAVSQWKRGENQPEAAKLIRAEEITGIPLEWFLTGDGKYLRDKSERLSTPDIRPTRNSSIKDVSAKVARRLQEMGLRFDSLPPERRAEAEPLIDVLERELTRLENE